MDVIINIPAAVCIVGLLLWAVAPRFNWKLEPIPTIMFAVGLLWWVHILAREAIKL